MRRGLVLIALVAALLVMGRHPRLQAAAGRPIGGFADINLDFDGDGVGDLQVEDDVFLVANHSGKANPAQGEPAVLPGASKNGSPDYGVGFAPGS